MGWLSDKLFGKRKSIDINKIKEYQQNTQNMINTQQGNVNEYLGMGRNFLGMGEEFMDMDSSRNVQMRGLLANIARRQASDQGAQIGNQMMQMGAQGGMSPAQAMMQARMAQNQAMGGVGQGLLQANLAQMQGAVHQGENITGCLIMFSIRICICIHSSISIRIHPPTRLSLGRWAKLLN